MNRHPLTGLDGTNPLGFLAALGTLTALDDLHAADEATRPRLHWERHSTWTPVLTATYASIEEVVDVLDADRQERAKSPALRFSYPVEKKGKITHVREVKASPEELRAALLSWTPKLTPGRRLVTDWFHGFVEEGPVDGNGRSKPTAFHFLAGQQRFLKSALTLAQHTKAADFTEALVGPWTYQSNLDVMGWDSTESRDHALRSTDPSSDKKTGNPGADWLGLVAIESLPVCNVRSRQTTPGVQGGWKSGTWAWPLWSQAIARSTVQSLLRLERLRTTTAADRERRGIAAVMETRITRSDQGGYGSVSAARVLP